uniref:Calcium-binding and coiled-coil domain-containing protein 2 n=1 Tax=Neovison vison TaxID=452646 RepID=A0A8C7AFI7_NEOVI
MEETVEDPPTSAVLLDHCHFSQVIFNSVEKFYVPGGDVTCYYTLTQHFIPRRKDWIGIFRVGWKTTREYYTFMWVTLPIDLNSESAKQQEVQFKAYYLPKDDEYYQFCYVDQDGVVRGASIPFQFRPENEEDILVVTTQGEVEEIEQHNKELRKENQELKDSCVGLQQQNSDMQAELHKKEVWLLVKHEPENKQTNRKHEPGPQRSELDGREHQKKLEQTVEEMKQEAAAAKKKQQQLTDENLGLSETLNENKIVCNVLQREKERLERENDLLKRENSRLLSYMGLDFDSLPYQAPTSDQGGAGQNPGLVYGNPYSGIQESSAPGLLAIKRCPTCKSDFTDDIFDHTLEQQRMQTLCLNCPICDKSFPATEKQIFEDHVFCHTL